MEKQINPELIGQLIDVFDDFLQNADVRLPRSDKEMERDGEYHGYKDTATRIYGRDYDNIADSLTNTLINWSVNGMVPIFINKDGEKIT